MSHICAAVVATVAIVGVVVIAWMAQTDFTVVSGTENSLTSWLSVAVAGLSTLVGAIGLLLVYLTLSATKRSISQQAILTATQKRPILVLGDAPLLRADEHIRGCWKLVVNLKNIGETEARNIRMHTQVCENVVGLDHQGIVAEFLRGSLDKQLRGVAKDVFSGDGVNMGAMLFESALKGQDSAVLVAITYDCIYLPLIKKRHGLGLILREYNDATVVLEHSFVRL